MKSSRRPKPNSFGFPIVWLPATNEIRHVRERFRFARDARGKISALECFITDITDRTLADERVRESENRYKLLAENMRDLVCLLDLDGRYLYVSPSSQSLLGYAPDELVGESLYDLVKPEDSERLRDEAHAQLLKGESGIIIEYRLRDKRGEYCWFETMAQTVAAPNGEIIQLQFVSRDVSKRKEAEEATRKAQEELAHLLMSEQEARRDADLARVELEHASRAKDEFLQMVSHEFRTPLTTIKTLVRVLQHDGKSEAVRLKHLETIAAECDRQIDMILNLLDVSRLEEGDVDLKREPVDINRVLYSCDKIERPAADARRQTLTVDQNQSLPKVSGDEKAMRRALCTIIENSIKYTPEGGTITVTARHVAHHGIKTGGAETDRKIAAARFGDLPKQMDFSSAEQLAGDEIAVLVRDTGRGILPEDVSKVFQKFYRGAKPHHDASTDGTPDDAAGKAETPGVGLGLYLAKRLIVALDGRVTVDSEPGRGSCFTIFLPVWNEKLHEKDTLDEYGFDENADDDEKTLAGG
ncbi:MAG: PAS domain-containing sensor histidine kinase [Acidobacteriota bacterium]|nr:PAS domain-containing sensor histidine kinase [Acidobacteriota bacterium]